MTDIHETESARLKHVLSKLEIQISEGPDGHFTAHSNSEPLFCVVRHNQKEVGEAVARVLESYVSTFYKVEKVKVDLIETAINTSEIPVERVKPVVRLTPKPQLGGLLSTGREYALG